MKKANKTKKLDKTLRVWVDHCKCDDITCQFNSCLRIPPIWMDPSSSPLKTAFGAATIVF